MTKKEEFKVFIKNNPKLLYQNKASMQKLFEIYDIYGDDLSKYSDFLESSSSRALHLKDLPNLFKNVNMDSIQEHISTAQKAIGLISELATNKQDPVLKNNQIDKLTEVNSFFED